MKDYDLSGKKLKMLREYLNISVEEAAKKLRISKESLFNIENLGALNSYDVDILFRFVELYQVPVSYILDHVLFDPHQYPFDKIDDQVYKILNMIKKCRVLETDQDPKEALKTFYDTLINIIKDSESDKKTVSMIQTDAEEYEDNEILDRPVTVCVKHGMLKGEHYVISISDEVSLLYNNDIVSSAALIFFNEDEAKDFMKHSTLFKELNNSTTNVNPYIQKYDGINYYDHGYAYIKNYTKKEEDNNDK